MGKLQRGFAVEEGNADDVVEAGDGGEGDTSRGRRKKNAGPYLSLMSLDGAAEWIDKWLDHAAVVIFPCAFTVNYFFLFATSGTDKFVYPSNS